MKLGVSFGHSLDPSETVQGAVFCETSGFETLFVSESTGIDSLTLLGAIATKTSTIGIGTGVVNVYSRSATQLAMASTTLSELSNWRFTLGIGSSSKSVVSDWHELDYSNQLQRVSASIDLIRKKIDQTNAKLRSKTSSKIPIILAAVGQNMISLARRKADGLIFFMRPLTRIRKDSGGSVTGDFQTCASVVTCVSEQEKTAENRVRKTVAFYVAFGEAYRKLLVAKDLELLPDDVATSIRREWMRGKIELSASLVPDDLLEEVTIFGNPASCRRKIEEYREIEALSVLALQFNPGSNNLQESISLLGKLAK